MTVTAAARALGVGRCHLSQVIHGLRISPTLLLRYQTLQARHAASPGAVSRVQKFLKTAPPTPSNP
ncbi:MAG TPA: hypothetical protein VFC44_06115 [Candidatus Saccharimonadales bacterium]|nr:hypothetical protein [Candidatus Saccharimonadales bacterium]